MDWRERAGLKVTVVWRRERVGLKVTAVWRGEREQG